MVQNLNLIMITSPELSDFRKRLRTLDSKVRLFRLCPLRPSDCRLHGEFRAGRPKPFCHSLSVVVSQRRRDVHSVFARSGVRAGLCSAADLVHLLSLFSRRDNER
jgi:hypothetical protein